MLIIYASKTGNVKRFIEKTGMDAIQITKDLQVDKPFILLTYTTGFGKVPPEVEEFMQRDRHRTELQGLVGSGNRNWGMLFCGAADKLSEQFSVPVLMKFELSGTKEDVNQFIQEVRSFETH